MAPRGNPRALVPPQSEAGQLGDEGVAWGRAPLRKRVSAAWPTPAMRARRASAPSQEARDRSAANSGDEGA
eukprot:11508711-Alexandrium_andersonii.AAC.2